MNVPIKILFYKKTITVKVKIKSNILTMVSLVLALIISRKIFCKNDLNEDILHTIIIKYIQNYKYYKIRFIIHFDSHFYVFKY